MFCTEQKVSQLSAKRFFSILTVLTPGWVGSYSHGHSQCLTSYSSIEAEYEMMQERTLKLSANLKVRVIQILSLNTPQTPSCEGCRKPICTNLSHVNKTDFGYSGGVLSKEEGKIGWQIIDSKAQLLSSSSRFKRHSDRCCQSTQDILYEKVASSLHNTFELLPSTKFRVLFFQKKWDRGTGIVSSYKLQATKVQPRSQVYSETVQNKSDVTGNTEVTRKT